MFADEHDGVKSVLYLWFVCDCVRWRGEGACMCCADFGVCLFGALRPPVCVLVCVCIRCRLHEEFRECHAVLHECTCVKG